MNPIKHFLEAFFRTYGGILSISVAGIALLVFAGILPVSNEIKDIRRETGALENQLAFASQSQPLSRLIESRRNAYHSLIGDRPPVQAYPSEDLETLGLAFRNAVLDESLATARVEVQLPDEPNPSHALLDLTVRLPFEALPPFFDSLRTWPHWNGTEAFSLTAEGRERVFALTLQVPIQ